MRKKKSSLIFSYHFHPYALNPLKMFIHSSLRSLLLLASITALAAQTPYTQNQKEQESPTQSLRGLITSVGTKNLPLLATFRRLGFGFLRSLFFYYYWISPWKSYSLKRLDYRKSQESLAGSILKLVDTLTLLSLMKNICVELS